MTKIKRLYLSKIHWFNMIHQADKFIKNKSSWVNVDHARNLMEDAIKQNWTEEYCPVLSTIFPQRLRWMSVKKNQTELRMA